MPFHSWFCGLAAPALSDPKEVKTTTMLIKGHLRWTLIFWMFLMSSIAYLDRVNISIAGSAIQKDYGLTNIQLGYVFSAFVFWVFCFSMSRYSMHIERKLHTGHKRR